MTSSGSDFWAKPKIVNLESSINLGEYKKLTPGIALQSDRSVVEFLRAANVKCVSMSNNHVFDYEIDIDAQRDYLKEHGIDSVGAGCNIKSASEPFYFEDENIVVLSFGWNVIRSADADESNPGVNPYEYSWIESCVKKAQSDYPEAKVITVFHWNYELEQYPQPADREFAFHLIDLGVDAVVGHYAHIIQSFEIYNDKPIFYGLGNFYFPSGDYTGFDLHFPPIASKGMSVDISDAGCKVYITEIVGNKRLEVIEEGAPQDITLLKKLSAFQGLKNNEYINYFRANRKKAKFLPIYKSFKNSIRNEFFDKYVIHRQVPVDLISKIRGRR